MLSPERDLPQALANACDAYNSALESLGEKVESWLLGELAALSARLPGRTVTLYSGNGTLSLEIERRRPLTWGDNAERTAFRCWDFTGQIPWARWVAVPAFLLALEAAEGETRLTSIAPVGAFAFRDGKPF